MIHVLDLPFPEFCCWSQIPPSAPAGVSARKYMPSTLPLRDHKSSDHMLYFMLMMPQRTKCTYHSSTIVAVVVEVWLQPIPRPHTEACNWLNSSGVWSLLREDSRKYGVLLVRGTGRHTRRSFLQLFNILPWKIHFTHTSAQSHPCLPEIKGSREIVMHPTVRCCVTLRDSVPLRNSCFDSSFGDLPMDSHWQFGTTLYGKREMDVDCQSQHPQPSAAPSSVHELAKRIQGHSQRNPALQYSSQYT